MSNRGLQSPNHQKEKNKNQTRQSFQSHLGIKSLQRRLKKKAAQNQQTLNK